MAKKHPDVTAGSTNKYQNWEVVDPEKWPLSKNEWVAEGCISLICNSVAVEPWSCGRRYLGRLHSVTSPPSINPQAELRRFTR
jgi:hypothetical protein